MTWRGNEKQKVCVWDKGRENENKDSLREKMMGEGRIKKVYVKEVTGKRKQRLSERRSDGRTTNIKVCVTEMTEK